MNNIAFNNYREAVAAAMAGDQEGFSYLYDKTFKNKYYVALKYVKNEDTASDIVQDSYMRAFQNLSMLQDPDKFPGWMGMIVANTAKNYLKKKNPVLFSEMDKVNDEGEVAEYQDTLVEDRVDFNPEEYYSKKEISDIVNEMIDSLPEEQRICMIMFYLEGQSLEEIAAALECSKNTVGSRLNYGRKKIKAKAEDLQKRGYKLYSFAPVALFAALLRNELNSYAMGTAAAAGAAGAAGSATTGTATGTTAGNAAAMAGVEAGAVVGSTATYVVSSLYAGDVINSINVRESDGATVDTASGASNNGSTVETSDVSVTNNTSGSVPEKSSVGRSDVGNTVSEAAGSGAGKTGFLSTVAGKVVAAVAGVAVVGGLVAGIIAITSNDKKDDNPTHTEYGVEPSGGKVDKTTEQISLTENTEQIVTENTEVSSVELTEATTEAVVKTDEELLQEYLENELIPEDGKYGGVFNPCQEYLAVIDGQASVYTSTYNYDAANDKLTYEYTHLQLQGSDSVDQSAVYRETHQNDFSGIYASEMIDIDNDGNNELLVIYGDDKFIRMDIYSVSSDKQVEINTGKDGNPQENIVLYKLDTDYYFSQYTKFYIMNQDGRYKMVVKNIEGVSSGSDGNVVIPAGDTAWLTVITLDDMKTEKKYKVDNLLPNKKVKCYLCDENGLSQDMMLVDREDMSSDEDDYIRYDESPSGSYHYVGAPTVEYLQSIGFYGDDVRAIGGPRVISELQRKYLFDK